MIREFDDCLNEFDGVKPIFESVYLEVKLKSDPKMLYISYAPRFLTYITYLSLIVVIFSFMSLNNFKEDYFYIVSAVILLLMLIRRFLDLRKIVTVFDDEPNGNVYIKKFGLFNTRLGASELIRRSSSIDKVDMIHNHRPTDNEFNLLVYYKNSDIVDLLGSRLLASDCQKCIEYINDFLKIKDKD